MKNWIALLICTALVACNAPVDESSKTEKEPTVKIKETVERYPNGALKMRGNQDGDKRIGLWQSFYPNGYKWSEINYVNGYREGSVVVYYQNGMMRYEGSYYNDERSGIWQFYDTTGVRVKKVNMDLPQEKVDSLLKAG